MPRILYHLALILTLLTLNGCKADNTSSSTPAANSANISTELNNKSAILLDVRTADEYNAGHVNAAILAPHDTIAQTIASIAPNKNQKIYLHCRSGRRSGIALDTLNGMGYTDVTNLGGLGDLEKFGLAIGK